MLALSITALAASALTMAGMLSGRRRARLTARHAKGLF